MRFVNILLSYEKVSDALVDSVEWPPVKEGGLVLINSLKEMEKRKANPIYVKSMNRIP